MLLLASSSAALWASFCVLTPRTISCHKIVNIHFDNIKCLLTVRWRYHSESKGLANNTTAKKTKPGWFRPRGADQSLQTKEGRRSPWRMRCASRIRWRPAMKLKQHRQAAVRQTWVQMLLCYSLAVWFGASDVIALSLRCHLVKLLWGLKRNTCIASCYVVDAQ